MNDQNLAGTDLSTRQVRNGALCAVAAHVMWGFFPLFWTLLDQFSSMTLTAHRVVWSFLLLLVLSILIPRLRGTWRQLSNPRTLVIYFLAAAMIGINWGSFMYAVGSEQVLQASLGYYINPLLNVLLGVVVLGERLKPFQWIAVGLAAIGVAVMTLTGSGVPWIALSMATAFAIYGLLKKLAPLPALEGLTIETGMLFPFAFLYLMLWSAEPQDGTYLASTWMLLMFGGVITVVPLALFAVAARRVSLATIGILQYVGPTLQWFVGAVLLGESFGGSKLIGFAFVWAGVVIFVLGGLKLHAQATRQRERVAVAD